MNKKGFTIVELLAVIGIIALLLILVIPRVQEASFNSRVKLCTTKMGVIENNLNLYLSSNKECFTSKNNNCGVCDNEPNNNECIVTIKTLADMGLVDYDNKNNDVINPLDKEPINDIKIKVIYNKSRFESRTLNVDGDIDDGYEKICNFSNSIDEGGNEDN